MKLMLGAGVRHQFKIEQVIAVTADVDYCFVHLDTGEQVHLSRTLKWFAERWPHFVRIHKNALVNLNYVHEYGMNAGKEQNGYVILKNGFRLGVSRRRLKEVILLLEPDEPDE